jgi:hypothetical protein
MYRFHLDQFHNRCLIPLGLYRFIYRQCIDLVVMDMLKPKTYSLIFSNPFLRFNNEQQNFQDNPT